MFSMIHHRGESNIFEKSCQACSSDLTSPEAVEIDYSHAGVSWSELTHITQDGDVDDPKDFISLGMAVGVSCALCGESVQLKEDN